MGPVCAFVHFGPMCVCKMNKVIILLVVIENMFSKGITGCSVQANSLASYLALRHQTSLTLMCYICY